MLENGAKTFGQPWGREIFLRIIRMRKKNKVRFMPYSDAVSKTFLRQITLAFADKRLQINVAGKFCNVAGIGDTFFYQFSAYQCISDTD